MWKNKSRSKPLHFTHTHTWTPGFKRLQEKRKWKKIISTPNATLIHAHTYLLLCLSVFLMLREPFIYLLLMPEMEIGWIVSLCILLFVFIVNFFLKIYKSYVITIIFSPLHANGKVNPSTLGTHTRYDYTVSYSLCVRYMYADVTVVVAATQAAFILRLL